MPHLNEPEATQSLDSTSTPMTMKDKKMNQIRLAPSGSLAVDSRQAELASASNGTAAQPTGPLSAPETKATNPSPEAPPALGEAKPADLVQEKARQDPNAQHPTTETSNGNTKPNDGAGKIVGDTDSK